MEQKVNVLVVDDQALVREGIASLLAIQPGIHVSGTAEDGKQALEQVKQQIPDVVLMDIKMPVMDGIEASRLILKENPQIKILMLTTLEDEEYIVKSLKLGASGYLLKDILAAELAQAIHLAYKGVHQLSPSISGKLVELQALPEKEQIKDEYNERLAELTPREMDVLRLIARGFTNREIASELYLSEGTVKNIVSSIFNCLGIHDRVQAAIIAIRHGLD
jgi:DNA-binding NarL/FixJ family response regulator